jgi:hypothetical protein
LPRLLYLCGESTIQALLAARLDQLDAQERDLLQCGSVEGRVFHRGAVQALVPGEPRLTVRLTALVRKELVRPDKAQLPGEPAWHAPTGRRPRSTTTRTDPTSGPRHWRGRSSSAHCGRSRRGERDRQLPRGRAHLRFVIAERARQRLASATKADATDLA